MRQFTYQILVACTVGGLFVVGCGDAESTGVFGNTTGSSSGSGGRGGEGGIAGAGGMAGAGGGTAGSGGTGGGGSCMAGQTQSCFTGDPTTLGIGQCVSGTQSCVNGMFGSCTGEVTAGPETCNGVDDDCNGTIDDGIVDLTCGIGACQVVAAGCMGGKPGACVPLNPQPEVCDGVDNNCDGKIDENCPCTTGAMQTCYTGPVSTQGVGNCKDGSQSCVNGTWGACTGDVVPKGEICNGQDDDCNGQSDEGLGTTVCGLGACQVTAQNCVNGTANACTPLPPSMEVCDGLDNDCNGKTDEGCQCQNGQTQACYSGPAGTQNVGQCKDGVQTCASGMFGACVGEVKPSAEMCDGIDNDCNGAIDDGSPGGGAVCVTGKPGVCSAGTSACTGGAIVCNQNTQASTESCDGLDNDCNGAADDGNPGGGMGCMTGQQGACAAGTTTCTAGMLACNQTTMAAMETCDGVDNDCNGMVDDGVPGLGVACNTGMPGVCAAGTTACTGGAVVCVPKTMASAEVCDNLDNDCNGAIDNGNPGGGVACGPSLGACTTQTACVAGAVVCRGTFVGPTGIGGAMNPGTQASPLSTIAAAQANAAIIGGGADVCVCDTAAAGASVYPEDITMVEGISVLGGYNCADWSRNIATYVTTIQDTTNTGVKFPAGITSITALDGMTVQGLGGNIATSSAISVTNSSPSLLTVTATSGLTANSFALNVAGSNGGVASPTVTAGSYTASATGNNSLQVGVNLSSASGTFTNVIIAGGPSSGVGAATTSVGMRCADCGATTISGGSINGAAAASATIGLWGTGNVTGLNVTNTTIGGGSVTQAAGVGWGVRLETCNGSPTFTTTNILGGSVVTGSRFGIESTGAMCAPSVVGGTVRGCETGNNCTGMSCSTNSQCTATNAIIRGASGTANATSYGVRCATSGCGKFAGNTIAVGNLGNNATTGMGIDIVGANPPFDDNDITSPLCPNGAGGNAALYAAHFSNTTSLVTNNVIRDQPCFSQVDVVRFDKLPGVAGTLGPTIHSNTIQFATCNGCPSKRGLVIASQAGAIAPAAGIVRNNIFRNAGMGNFATGFAVRENDFSSDLSIFENNDLWSPGGTLYWDEGTTPLLLVAVNALMGSANNISGDPLLDATYHIPIGSPCRNAGTMTGAPAFDFDANVRPQEMVYDIGADEYMP